MTVERMIELLEIEKECVLRNASGECNRYCAGCDLLQDDTELHEMYTEAIAMLKAQEPRVIIDEELMDRIRKAPIVQIPAADAVLIQEPRVMTLAEVEAMPYGHVLIETDKKDSLRWLDALLFSKNANYSFDFITLEGRARLLGTEYNREWRCWTSKPTDEHRESVKWD